MMNGAIELLRDYYLARQLRNDRRVLLSSITQVALDGEAKLKFSHTGHCGKQAARSYEVLGSIPATVKFLGTTIKG